MRDASNSMQKYLVSTFSKLKRMRNSDFNVENEESTAN